MTGSFEGCKVVVAGGSSGMGKGTAAGVVAGGGSAVIIGRNEARVDETVAEPGKQGTAGGITADLADRAQVEAVREQLASGHADAALPVDAASFFIPRPFLEHDAAFYDPSSATFTQVTSGGKMSTPTGDNASLRAVELNVRAELALAETGQPEEEAADVPIGEWLVDPEDEQRYEVSLRSLLGAVEALEGGSGEVSREPEPTPTANADEVERHPCPRCSVEPGSPCRSRSGTVAAAYHTGRFMKVPRLAKRLRVPTPADRGPGQLWRPGTPP